MDVERIGGRVCGSEERCQLCRWGMRARWCLMWLCTTRGCRDERCKVGWAHAGDARSKLQVKVRASFPLSRTRQGDLEGATGGPLNSGS